MTYYAHTIAWPLLTLLLAVICLILLDRLISLKWPKLRFHRMLFNRHFRDRHPVRFVLSWLAVIGVWFACTALVQSVARETGGNSLNTEQWDVHHGRH
jgi:hypothetical protein